MPARAFDFENGLGDRSLTAWKSDRELLRSLRAAPRPTLDPLGRLDLADTSRSSQDVAFGSGWQGWIPLAVSLTALGLITGFAEPPRKARWSAINDFDETLRDAMTPGSSSGRQKADVASNILLWGTVGLWAVERSYAGVEEARALRSRQPELTAWDTTRMAGASLLEGLRTDVPWMLLTAAVTQGTKAAAGRARPKTSDCLALDDGSDCGGRSGNNSFFSGHTSFSAAAAGLICNNRLSRLDRGVFDVGLCALGGAMAFSAGTMRIVGDEHWTTDVIAGTATGILFGFVLPKYLTFGRRPEPAQLAPRLRLQPLASAERYGLRLSLRY